MASGDTLCTFTPLSGIPPAANYATLDSRNSHVVADFDAATDETIYFEGFLPAHYDGGGLTVTIWGMLTSATSGSVRLEAAIERHDTGTDLDSDSFASAKSAALTASGTSGAPSSAAISFASGAEMDSLAAGEHFRLLIRRDADGTTGTDDATGDFELLGVHVTET